LIDIDLFIVGYRLLVILFIVGYWLRVIFLLLVTIF